MKTIKTNPKQSNIFENVVNRFEEKRAFYTRMAQINI